MRVLSLLLVAPFLTSAQDAIVVQLQPETSAKIAHLYAEKARIEKELNDETERIGEVYSRWGDDIAGTRADGTAYKMKPRHAFKFSTDFKYIVPDEGKPAATSGILSLGSGCGWTTIPAVGGMSLAPTAIYSNVATN